MVRSKAGAEGTSAEEDIPGVVVISSESQSVTIYLDLGTDNGTFASAMVEWVGWEVLRGTSMDHQMADTSATSVRMRAQVEVALVV